MTFHKIINAFDPFGWMERFASARWLYRIINACMLLVVLGFLIVRFRQYDDFAFKPLWVTETLLFIVLAIAFGIRREPIDRSRGVAEIIIPLIGSALPFGLLFTQPSVWLIWNAGWVTAVFFWMTLATGFTAWSMWCLRRSFSITVEARELVMSGPYQWVRHPVYLGEIFAAAAVVVWRWSLVNVALFIIFVLIQLLRARGEEEKLSRVFPEYRNFAGRSWWVGNKEP
jgi:protein-S-isoprenylcysteine O-methyltransferase Ste14